MVSNFIQSTILIRPEPYKAHALSYSKKTNGYREVSTRHTESNVKGRFYQIHENLSIDKQEVDAF